MNAKKHIAERARSAITGRFVPIEFAASHPKETVVEKVKPKSPAKGKHK